ncbi:hypothetical protein INT44_006010 [Umbelopsis vinacea]|uniref:Methyltransferase domain-containing protein n=1 Tax=Umbelopsis vinacea TaxID=44442 RepID=A0A8H7PYI5_9FUNG|nr:hypothetical protein INT44_006010 [Umbelopsis vinacea]
MGNQASKIMDKAKDRSTDRKSRHPSRALSVKSSSAASTSEQPSLSSKMNFADTTFQAIPPNLKPSRSQKTNKSGVVIDQDDFKEIDRSQRQHYVLKSIRKTNHWAPYNRDGVILDIGTGHGDWAYEVASTYPKSKIIALDLNPPHAPATILNNLVFKHIDITQRWDIEDNSVDFVFQRDMNRVLLKSNWDHILREMYRVTQPGGVLEILESGKANWLYYSIENGRRGQIKTPRVIDRFTTDFFHYNAGPVQAHADEFFKAQCEHIGRDCDLADHLAADLINVGFINVEQKSLDIPVGEWPSDPNLKQIGFNNFELQRSKLKSLRSAYVEDMGLSGDDYDAASKLILAEFEEYQGYTKWVCWTAEKPS